MELNSFLKSRKEQWQQLAALLDLIDRKSFRALSPEQAEELFELYRLASGDLNLIQTRTANSSVLDYLENLVARAYAVLTVPEKKKIFRAWFDIVRHRFPAAIRVEKAALFFAAIVFLLGSVFGFFCILLQPDTIAIFLPPEHLRERPAARVSRLEQMERKGNTRVDRIDKHATFSTFLFTHNIKVTVFGFALGLTFGVGTVLLLFYNGALLGAIAAAYLADGVIVFFMGWVGPHGAIEIPCILFGCTAGFIMSRAQFKTNQGTLAERLKAVRPEISTLLIGTSSFLVLAGLIEGGFSQINEPTIPYWFKISTAVVLFAAFTAYLFYMPVRNSEEEV